MRIASSRMGQVLAWLISAYMVVFFSYADVSAQFFARVTDAGEIVTDAFFSSGASWTDINNDGWPDLYALGESTNHFYLNNGDGTFASITEGHFVTSHGVANIGIWADYDNDGYTDLFLGNTTTQPGGNVLAPNFLYRNAGPPLHDLTLVDLGNDVNASPSASWIDYDQDGDLDLYSAGAAISGGTATRDLFYRNDGNSVFVQLDALPLLQARPGVGTHDVWIDFDNDGDADPFVLNWASPNEQYKSLLVETGNPNSFQRITSNGLLDEGSFFDISSNWGDYDNDGDFDVFIAFSNNTTDRLYENNGDGTFSRVMANPMVSSATSTSFAVWGDYDNDGDLDLFAARVALNPALPALYRNEGGGQFLGMTQSEVGDIVDDMPAPQGGSWGDYDNDGDLDLYVLTYAIPNRSTGIPQPNYLVRNDQGNSNNWLTVTCVGGLSNRSAIGAKIRAKAHINGQAVWQTRRVSGGASSFVFQAELRTHFGLGNATAADSLVIEWPSGIVQVLENVSANQFLTVTEEIPPTYLRPNFYAVQTMSPDTNAFTFQFVDVSLTDPQAPVSAWEWDFDSDGEIDSHDPNPAWTYTVSKRTLFPVKLRVSNSTRSAELVRENYIEVGPLPNTTADTQRWLLTGIPSNLARLDTTFYVHNAGKGADSIFVAISNYGGADSNAVSVNPKGTELAAGDSLAVVFSIFPPLLPPRQYVIQIRIRSKFNPGAQEFAKTVIMRIDNTTAVETADDAIPQAFDLLQNHPNPFNSSTSMRFDLPKSTHVTLKVFNIQGQQIKALLNGSEVAGRHSVKWDGRDDIGRVVGSGLYLYRIQTPNFSKTQKLIFMK